MPRLLRHAARDRAIAEELSGRQRQEPNCLRRVGPERAGDFGFRAERMGPKRARAQLRGRPISETALVILECKEAFENTELSPLNAIAQQPGGQAGRAVVENRNGARSATVDGYS
jgi:hypothetical protein